MRLSNLNAGPPTQGGRGRRFASVIILSVTGLILIAQSIFSTPLLSEDAGASKSAQPRGTMRLRDFRVVRPRFIVRGMNLSKVEIWCAPMGTGLELGLMGTATRLAGGKPTETWVLSIPPRFSCVEIFALAFDKNGKEVGRQSLPYPDPGALWEALYGKR